MNLAQLRYIVEVEKARSITKAAKNLFMGQPNLSKSIKELETEVNFSIFRRTAKGVEPTEKGAEFLGYAKTILSQMDELESMYKPRAQAPLELRICAPRASYLSALFAEFVSRMPKRREMSIRFNETSSISAINMVSSGEADLGIIRYQELYEPYFMGLIQEHRLDSEVLRVFTHFLVMSREHPLAEYGEIPYHMLDGYTEIIHGDFQVPSLPMSELKKSAEFSAASRRIYVYDRGSQLDLLERAKDTFMWVSQIPQDMLDQRGLVLRRCVPQGNVNKDVLIRNPRRSPGALGEQFVDYLRRAIPAT